MRFLIALLIVLAAGMAARADYRSPYTASRTHFEVRGVSPYVYAIEPSIAQSWEGWRRSPAVNNNRFREPDPVMRWYDSLLARRWYRHGTRYEYYGQFGRYGVYHNIPQSTLGRPQLDRDPRSNVYPRPERGIGPQRPRPGIYSGTRSRR